MAIGAPFSRIAVLLLVASSLVATVSGQNIVTIAKPDAAADPLLRSAFLELQQEMPDKTSEAILAAVLDGRESLLSGHTVPGLTYTFDGDHFTFSTTAAYGATDPVCVGEPLDFDILAAVNFGLRGYRFSGSDCVTFETGEHNTAYYSVAYDPETGRTAFAIPGQGRIDVFGPDMTLLTAIPEISATTIEFQNGDLWIAGYAAGSAWDKASLFKYDFEEGFILTALQGQLADSRGLAFRGETIAVADGYHRRLLFLDATTMAITDEIRGLSYPNGVSFTPNGDLIVADEHHNLIRRFDTETWVEVWRSPEWQLLSPAYAEEIPQGKFAGHLLVADADGNRIIVVDPESWTIKHEIGNIPSVLKAVAVF